MADETVVTAPTIKDIWNRDEKTQKNLNVENAFQDLQISADTYIGTIRKTASDIKRKYEESLIKAIDNSNFQEIAEQKLKLDAETVRFNKAVETYKSLFNVEPRITSL